VRLHVAAAFLFTNLGYVTTSPEAVIRMLRNTRDQLSTPYTGTEQETAEVMRWKALQADVPQARALREQVSQDRSRSDVRGVYWWKDHLDDPRRILLSDYLDALIYSVSINLCEAAIHLEELEEHRRNEHSSIVKLSVGRPPRAFGRPGKSVLDDLSPALVDMHSAGFFRALASAIDCFASCAGIVCCVPVHAQQMEYGKVKAWLFSRDYKAERANHAFAVRELTPIMDLWKQKADGDWVKWLLAMRHQYVHRARRMIFVRGEDGLQFVDGPGHEIVITRPVHHLPDQPQYSEVQAFRHGKLPILPEPINNTTAKLKRFVKEYINEGFARLNEIWVARRSDPGLCRQPDQWSNLFRERRIDLRGFVGAPSGQLATQLMGDARMHHTLLTSALDDPQRHLWDMWDPPEDSGDADSVGDGKRGPTR